MPLTEHTYADVAAAADVPPGGAVAATLTGEAIVLANVDGRICAMQRRCPHFGANLANGKLDGRFLTCPKQAAVFDVTVGEVSANARVMFLKFKTKRASTYSVQLDGSRVLVGA